MVDIKTKLIENYKGPLVDCGWVELTEKGFHPAVDASLTSPEECKTFVAYSEKGGHLGVLSFWIDDLPVGGDANVAMIYVKPEFRGVGVSKILYAALDSYCSYTKVNSL